MLRMKSLLPLAAFVCAAAFAAPPAGTKIADEANAKTTQFVLAAPATVSYGAGAAWVDKTLDAGTYACHPATFGLPGSMSTPRKQCKLTLKGGGVVAAALPPVLLAMENDPFSLAVPTVVTFGLDGKTTTKALPAGGYTCDLALFGADPLPTIRKACTAPTGASSAPAVAAPPATDSVSDAAEYRRIAALFGTKEGIEYRYGLPSTAPALKAQLPGPRPSQSYDSLSGQNPNGKGSRGCGWGGDHWCGTYQLGTLSYDAGDYSSSIINFSYVPATSFDKTAFPAAGYYGHGSAQGVSVSNSTVSWRPETSWTTYDGSRHNGGENDENTERMLGIKAGSNAGTIPANSRVIGSARGYGRGGWTNNTLILWDTGYITASGSNTSHNFVKIKLPDGKTPTAIALTNSGELALVTVMDVASMKGQVVVIALKDGCFGCVESNEPAWNANWGQPRQAMAGFPGLGNYIGGKILGTVDLPSDLSIPTEISVSTGRPNDASQGGYDIVPSLWNEPINSASQRARFYNGDKRGAMANTGMAVVISRQENRATFIDLRPLMTQLRETWVGPKTDTQWNAMVANRGDGDNQTPPTFAAAPAQKPVVVKTIAFASKPTAVKLTLVAPYRALIATEDGDLHLLDLGTGYLNQANGSTSSGKPEDIIEKFSIAVGGNPTSIAYVKGKATQRPDGKRALWGYDQDDQFFLVASREARKVSLIRFDAAMNSAAVYKTMQDARVIDPIAVEDTDNHGTESYLAGVADYMGQQIVNFAYGPVITWTYGRQNDRDTSEGPESPCKESAPCGPVGKDAVEFTGGMKLPGYPFHLSGGNIN